MNKSIKITYIASLSHSGSTILGIILGAHSDTICLGEIYPSLLYGKGQSDVCTCGQPFSSCPIWGNFSESKTTLENYAESYCNLVKHASNNGEKVVIDCSKRVLALQPILKCNKLEIKVIWLLKDIRSYIYSQIMRKKRTELMQKDSWRRIYTTTILYNILQWRIGNGKILHFLKQNKIPFIKAGYEELCFHSEKIIKIISDFTGIKYEFNTLNLQPAQTHMMRGNRLRMNNASKIFTLRYDYRWMKEPEITKSLPLIMPFMKWNIKHVYSNSEISNT